jgi:hypothetical protein
MAVSLTHATLAVGTNAGNGEVNKELWNEAHAVTADANTIFGFDGSGNPVDLTPSEARALLDLEIGTDVQAYSAALGQLAGLGDPNADRLVFWDDSAGSFVYLTAGSGLSISTTTMTVSVNNGNWSGTDLSVANGGTGVSTLTGIVKGNGTSAFSAATQGADYYAPGGTDVAVADGGSGVTDGVAGKQNIFVPAQAFRARTTNGAEAFEAELATNDVMAYGYAFDTSTVEAIQMLVSFPKMWNEGTITFRYYWMAETGSGGVAFSMRGRAVSDNDVIDGSWGTAITVTDTLLATGDMQVSAESSAVTIGGSPAEGDMIWLEIARQTANGSDTMATDAILLGVDIYITTNAGTDA